MTRFSVLFILFLTASGSLLAKAGESIFDRWSHADKQTIDLRFNMDSLLDERNTLNSIRGTVVDSGLELEVDITVRGRFRRRTCEMPPILLQFDKDGLRLAGLNTHNDYKLVTHCTDGEEGQDALVREEVAYRLYRTIDPEASFRTQLLTINYINTADNSTFSSYAILIEDTDELKDRMDADNCKECYNAPLATYANAESVALFQYMIGNADYSTRLIRNLKLMRDDSGLITAVPYDFDFSGLVNPSYGVLLNKEQTSFTDRVWMWEFADGPALEQATVDFLIAEDELMNVIADTPELSKKSSKEITRYLKGFFRQLKSGKIGA